jgi:hypothetical protein
MRLNRPGARPNWHRNDCNYSARSYPMVTLGALTDPAFPPTQSSIADLQAVARTRGPQLTIVYARTDSDLEGAFATFSQQRTGAVVVSHSNFYTRRMEQLAGTSWLVRAPTQGGPDFDPAHLRRAVVLAIWEAVRAHVAARWWDRQRLRDRARLRRHGADSSRSPVSA